MAYSDANKGKYANTIVFQMIKRQLYWKLKRRREDLECSMVPKQ